MEIRIGITQSGRELNFEVNDSANKVRKTIDDALASDNGIVSFTDVRGATYLVNAEQIAYIEIGAESSRKVGFVG